ncbi:MAG TPA: hypothetical protein VF168_13540 [Trueperaceae bacterium]
MSSLRRAQHVLVAEPRPEDLHSIISAIGGGGHLLVTHSRTGSEVIEVLQNSGKPGMRPMPSVLLLDLELDDPGPIELITKLRACPRTRCMPIVALDPGASRELVGNAYAAGINSCLSKPASYEEFQAMIERLTRYWLRLNQLPHQLGAASST